MVTRIGVNGGGRIGRLLVRMAAHDDRFEIAGINTRQGALPLAHLLKYDCVQGRFPDPVLADDDHIQIAASRIPVIMESQPSRIPWQDLGVHVVVEATGKSLTEAQVGEHVQAGAERVLLTTPGKGFSARRIVESVNDHSLEAADRVVLAASCTTNCAAPMLKVLHEAFGVEAAFVNTVHAYTSDPRLVGPHPDLRRARCSGLSIIPTATGAAEGIGQVLPELAGRITASAIRVPTPDGSMVDLLARLGRPATVSDLRAAFRSAADNGLEGVLEYCEGPLVSADVIGNDRSCVFDACSAAVAQGDFVKLLGWYDNEWSFARRCLNLARRMSALGPPAEAGSARIAIPSGNGSMPHPGGRSGSLSVEGVSL